MADRLRVTFLLRLVSSCSWVTELAPRCRMVEQASVRLYSSWRGILGGLFGAVAVAVLGLVGVGDGGGWLSVSVAIFGAVLLAVMLFDFPLSSLFHSAGITRKMVLRRQLLAWDRIDRLERSGRAGRRSGKTAASTSGTGGVVARLGRRRYLVCNQVEGAEEFEQIRQLLQENAPGLANDLGPSGEHRVPTSLYRQRPFGRLHR